MPSATDHIRRIISTRARIGKGNVRKRKRKRKRESNTTINNMSMPEGIDPFANPKKNLEFFSNAMEFVMIGLDNGGNEGNDNDGPQPKRQRAMKSRYT